MSYDNDYGSLSDIPEATKSYLRGFQVAIDSQNVDQILQCYETDWNKITERYYKTQPWPHWKIVDELSNHDGVFILLYKGKKHDFRKLAILENCQNLVFILADVINCSKPVSILKLKMIKKWNKT